MFKKKRTLKEFGPVGFKITEEVAQNPSLGKNNVFLERKSDFFCLRIDADEYTSGSFDSYWSLFNKYKNAMTIFFNVYSFRKAEDQILKCKDMGIDVQSHAFYHYTYNDYANNRHNICKAKEYFLGLGIDTKGFAAPFGRWNRALMQALEDEGYEYSSDFSYDYMGFPSYPFLGKRYSRVMEIPIFPVAPEAFFQDTNWNFEIIEKYYKNAIDELVRCNLPVIIYAHTNPLMPLVPSLLRQIADYAIEQKGLSPVTMTRFHQMCRERTSSETEETRACTGRIPREEFLGRPARKGVSRSLKDIFKDMIDFERVTPPEELKCTPMKKNLKLFARKIL